MNQLEEELDFGFPAINGDKFVLDNLLNDDDFGIHCDLALDPLLWQEMNRVNEASEAATGGDGCSPSLGIVHCFDSFNSNLTPPDTPPSSDRSTPPATGDFVTCLPSLNVSLMSPSSLSQYPGNNSPVSATEAFEQQIHHHQDLLVSATAGSPTGSSRTYLPRLLPAPLPSLTVSAAHKTQTAASQPLPPTSNSSRNATNRNGAEPENKLEVSKMLREARKLRNREAASVSRRKQKQYLETLESRVDVLSKENHVLMDENGRLKARVSSLEEENSYLRVQGPSNKSLFSGENKNKRKAVSLLAVVFMLGFNLAPFTGVFIPSTDNSRLAKETPARLSDHRNGRSLLWTSDNSDPLLVENSLDNRILRGDLSDNTFNHSLLQDPKCQTFINKTESMRLENELRGWVSRVEKEKEAKKKKRKPSAPAPGSNSGPKKPLPLARMKSWLNYHQQANLNDLELIDRKLNDLAVSYKDLLDAIHRRDDTFYFLSFSAGDHLLLPAEANQTAVRPRFSVIMPALNTVNESSPGTGINNTYKMFTMMQIDCEVMNTKVVLLRNLVSSGREPGPRTHSDRKANERPLKRISSSRRGRNKNAIN